ncbi:hypothetical protein BH23BAC3_BH23BAC3_12320 [soil metagenome]
MLTDQEVTQKQYNTLVEDAQYLADESEALKYIIDEVPYSEVPSGGMSIIQKLALIDHAQNKYYRPLIEKIFTSNRIIHLKNFDHFTETFEVPDDDKDVQKVLNKIIKHRAGIINLFKKIPLIDWERAVKNKNDKTISLYKFAEGMIKDEREQLKEIADLVLIYQNNKQANRQVNAKARQRHNTGD